MTEVDSVKITIFTFAHSSLIKGIFQKSSFFWHLLHLRRLKQIKGSLIEVLNSSKIFFTSTQFSLIQMNCKKLVTQV